MWLDLRVGYRCNNRCRFCDQGERRALHPDATFDALVAVLARERSGAEAVWLAGGEVTLRPDLPRLVEAARALGYTRVGLQTNGRILAAPGAAEALRARGLTDAVVALHAATPALHDWLTREDGAFRQATAGLRRLVAAGVATRVATVLTRSGTAEIGALAALALRLGAEGHRWILARAAGAAAAEWRMLLPRLALVRGPVAEAVLRAWDVRRDAETVGIPLCLLGDARAAAADRADSQPVRRAFPDGYTEAAPARRHGPPCAGCALRPACPGVLADYADRFGWDEIVPPHTSHGSASASRAGPPPPRAGRPPATTVAWIRAWAGGDPVPGGPTPAPEAVFLHVEAACPLRCPACATRAAYAADAAMTTEPSTAAALPHGAGPPADPSPWPTEPERALRRRLVRAASEGARTVVFAGASPWSHPSLPAMVREARRLGFARIEVWGPIEPVHALPPAAAEKLEGLGRVRAPLLGREAGGGDAFASALSWFATHLPACEVNRYTPDTPPGKPMYQAAGPRAVWASCQRSPD